MTGKSAPKKEIIVPPGTQIIDAQTGEILFDMLKHGETRLFLKGGRGGLGNTHFKSATNQRPTYAQPGEKGETRKLRLELKLIADVGLVGFPNVGKSTLISTLSNAKPEVANYEFTTLTPKLGQVSVGDYDSFVMADIPGIIGGASEGKGLGLKFLQHIERTSTLLYMIDLDSYRELKEQFFTLKKELEAFSSKLATANYAIALTRSDIVPPDELDSIVAEFISLLNLEPSGSKSYNFDGSEAYYLQEISDESQSYDISKPYFIAAISSATHKNIEPLKHALVDLVKKGR